MKRGEHSADVQLRRERLMGLLEQNPKPLPIRNLFYQLAAHFGYPKVGKEGRACYKAISRDLTDMRWNGQVPWDWIADGSRRRIGATSQEDLPVDEAVTGWVNSISPVTSIWGPLGLRPQVWIEAESATLTIEPVTRQYEVGLWPAKGHSSKSFLYQGSLDQPTHVGVLSDWDRAGRIISNQVRKDLGRLGCFPEFKRLAVLPEQIVEWDLPEDNGQVQFEAIPAARQQKIVEDWILSLLPDGAWEAYEAKVAEQEEQVEEIVNHIREWLDEHDL